MTASLPLLTADDDFDRPTSPRVRFQELTQVWAIVHPLLLYPVCGTTYLSTDVGPVAPTSIKSPANNGPVVSIYVTLFLEFRQSLKTNLFC